MLDSADARALAQTCVRIGNETADAQGFVPLHRLLDRFRAKLILRPLLVEAMLATIQDPPGQDCWVVLIDSEQYPLTHDDILAETAEKPLHPRLRNSVAHELAHSLAFRASEFGVRLQSHKPGVDQKELVSAYEQETERLSPLLLCSESSLTDFVASQKEPFSAAGIRQQCRRYGISRQVFIRRLQLLGIGTEKGPTYYTGLKNLGIGIGEWTEGGRAVLRNWPLFINFERNVVPTLFLRVRHQDRMPATEGFNDWQLALSGGEFAMTAGTSATPEAESVCVRCEVESGPRSPGSSFLYTVRRLASA